MTGKAKSLLVAAILILGLAVLLFEKGSRSLSSSKDTILFVPKTIDGKMEFWQVMKQGVSAAAKEYGAKIEVAGTDTELDIDGQIALREKAIPEKPRAILLAATDYNRLVPVARKIIDAGITLITVDSGLNGVTAASFIATDNEAAGYKAGEEIKRRTEPGARIAVINFVKGSATAMERERGVLGSLQQNGGRMIDGIYYSDGSEEKAYEIVKNILLHQPEISGIVGLNEPSTVGAAKAIKHLSAQSRVKLVGFDSSMDEIAALEDGVIQAIVVQKPFNMGYLAVQTAIQAVNGHKVDRRIDTGSELITKDNMYTNENQKLLFPFLEK
jgi:ribose transport system substrate-binding protein